MDNLTIKKLLRTFNCFKGVFPCDKLPHTENIPLNIIINTDPSDKPGEHWVAISINRYGVGYYFDSFGLPPLKYEIIDFLDLKCIYGWSFNKITLQNVVSSTCGLYCITFIIFKCQNRSNERFLKKFNTNTIENDKRMMRLFKDFSLVDEI